MDDSAKVDEVRERAAEINEEVRPVTIEADVVTRPASTASPTVHEFLRHLRAKGLNSVQQPISLGEESEQLGFLDGESGGDGWYHQHDDPGLASAARLLRAIHDAGRDWSPPADAVWGAEPVPGDDLVFCHGDPGPGNFGWRSGEAVGLIDWDYLHPAPRLDDVAYALHWFVPLRSDELAMEWHHFPEVPDRRHRIQVFLDAYGDLPHIDVVAAVTARMQATVDLMVRLAEDGVEPQRSWVAEGALEAEELEIAWVRSHGPDFT